MATLTVWKYSDPETAGKARERVEGMQSQELITVHDAVVVTWPAGAKKPKTKQMVSTAGVGAAGGAFWGMLFGLIFLVPWFGLAFGAASGAIAGALSDFGIDDDFIKSVRDRVTPGTSALFLLSSGEVADRIASEMTDMPGELIATNLSVNDEAALKAIFATDDSDDSDA